jgi:hypothetical protein
MSGSAYYFLIKYSVNGLMLKTETLKRKSCNGNEIKTNSSAQQSSEERESYSFLPSNVSSSCGAHSTQTKCVKIKNYK